jgi:hypothetical protein
VYLNYTLKISLKTLIYIILILYSLKAFNKTKFIYILKYILKNLYNNS